MTERSYDTRDSLLDALGSEFPPAGSGPDVFQASTAFAKDVLDADVCVLAEKEDAGLTSLATSPADWSDTDGLLSPASLPSVVASRGVSYLVADRGDVRGATEAESLPSAATREYRSLLIVPYGEGAVLIAGDREGEAFTAADLELLRAVSSFARTLSEHVETEPHSDDDREHVAEAAAGLSHDAENFLGIIEGRLTLAREEPEPEHFDAIERATNSLRELIEDTRTLLEAGPGTVDPEPVPLGDVVHEAWQVEQTERAEIVTTPLTTVLADRSRLRRLFGNLVRNAVEHAGPEVTVWVGMLPDGDGFYVEDDGPGIDPSERESVLQFAYSTSAEHTGIGLSIVQWIAAAHGWDVSITEGKLGGTRFAFEGVDVVS